VAEDYRRQGIATNLIKELQEWAKQRGAYVIFVQADNVDAPAVALYTKLASSVEKDITHFDIPV
jgi:aminoglycoside 3-N-acetyltransferase I